MWYNGLGEERGGMDSSMLLSCLTPQMICLIFKCSLQLGASTSGVLTITAWEL